MVVYGTPGEPVKRLLEEFGWSGRLCTGSGTSDEARARFVPLRSSRGSRTHWMPACAGMTALLGMQHACAGVTAHRMHAVRSWRKRSRRPVQDLANLPP